MNLDADLPAPRYATLPIGTAVEAVLTFRGGERRVRPGVVSGLRLADGVMYARIAVEGGRRGMVAVSAIGAPGARPVTALCYRLRLA